MNSRRTIAFISSSMLGHFYPTIELAHALVGKGLSIVYLLLGGTDLLQSEIRREGFECDDISGLLKFNKLNGLMRRAALRTARALLRQQVRDFKEVLDARDIGLVLADNFLRYPAILSTFNDIPAVNLCFNYSENVRVSDPVSRHDMVAAEVREAPRLLSLLQHWARNPGFLVDRYFGVQNDIERFAAQRKIATERFIFSRTRTFVYPSVYAAPRQLLRPDEARGIYLGLCVSRRRGKPCADFHAKAGGRKIIYVSLGTVNRQYQNAREVFRKVIQAFGGEKQYFVIVHVGAIEPSSLGFIPANVELRSSVPQMEIIRMAGLVITHGGLGTIKECIYSGKPMLVFPQMTEQLDNGRRIVSHGLGLMGDITALSAMEIRSLANIVMNEEGFTKKIENLKAVIECDNPISHGVDFLTTAISEHNKVSRTMAMQ